MKKLLTFLVIATLCFALNTPVLAVEVKTDERTGITYSIGYRTTIYCFADGRDEGNIHIQAFPGYQVYDFDTPLDSPEVVAGIAKMEAKITDTFDTLVSHSKWVAEPNLMDGFECTVTNSADDYWRFFDLPRNFKGTTVITRDGVPFTVTADGQGKLSFKVVTDYVGEKYAEFFIPTEVSHTKTVTKSEKYYLNHPGLEYGPYKTLDEVLEYCAEHTDVIDPNNPVKISVSSEHSSRFFVTTTHSWKLKVTYGNTPTHATADKKPEAPVGSTVSSTGSTTSGKKTETPVGSTVSGTESATASKADTTIPTDITDDSQTNITTNVSNVTSDKPSNTSAVWIVITAVILLGVAASVVVVLKHHKSE